MKRVCWGRLVLALSLASALSAAVSSGSVDAARQADAQLPSTPLKFGAFTVQFDPAGTFKLAGVGWPTFTRSWKVSGDEIELTVPGAPKGCEGAGKYRVRPTGGPVTFPPLSGEGTPRRVIFDRG